MEISFTAAGINFEKEISSLDNFVIDFTALLNKQSISYVIVSGYVAILFGRSRESEDVDLFIEKLSFDRFVSLWKSLKDHFECIITGNMNEAYEDYLKTGHAIRFARKNQYIPNIEIKFPKFDIDDWSLDHRMKVSVNSNVLFISPLELQIAYKLFLGSGKDIEDALHLYHLFKDNLDTDEIHAFCRNLKIPEKIQYLK